MIRNTFIKISTGIAMSVAILTSCVQKDDWDVPPINCTNKWEAPTKTMAELVAMAPSSGGYVIPNGENDPEIIIDGYVVSSDENGNFYKSISFQDATSNPTVGLQIEIEKTSNYADLPIGSHIRIRANGLVIALDRGVYKLGSVDPTYTVGRIPQILESRYISGVCSGNGLDIQTITPTEFESFAEVKKTQYINTLVKVKGAMFAESDLGKTYVDYTNGVSNDTDRNLVDSYGGTAVLRNSGYFTGGKSILPEGAGDITFVVSRYNSNYQMLIRSLNDVNFTDSRPVQLFKDTFDGALSTNWTAVSVTGAQVWNIQQFGNPKPAAVMNGFANGTNNENEDWLISNAISIGSTFSQAYLTFETDGRYNGNTLQAYVTTNYTGDPTTTSWTMLTDAQFDATLSSFGAWTSSGKVNLNAYIGQTVQIAFKYTSTSTAGTTWQLDNVVVNAK